PVEQVADASTSARPFPTLKGKLRLPVRGELMNRYGSPREEGGATWRGLFIRAAVGELVRAVADGRVVYADWLRGFGNLLILDHGGGYMSLYGYNDGLLRQVGEGVKGGDSVAQVGASGGAEESGLYFELRYDGKPFDPLRWVAR
ncbi:MAG TPA: peptidoglycan DD-metalloendopeptidase family protein, partial [Usitatibacteraceae bacterium]|nr:peptidoglycan DD-metalloendopeptidase family protein [Usitatibacteraceae bacterium]